MDIHEELTDEDIVKRVRSQDKEMYAVIMSRYQNKLLRYTKNLLRDEHQAIDVVQDAFTKAFVNLHGFDTRKRFSNWLYRIAHNEAMNAIKKSRREISLPEGFDMPGGESIESEVGQKETAAQVEQCLREMPVMYAEPLSLRYIEERSYEEISDILRLPMGTVAARLSRAKAIMKKICQSKQTT